MLVSYGASVVLLMPLVVLFGARPGIVGLVLGGHLLLSLALYRWSRAAFLGIDYWIDPNPDPHDDDDRDDIPAGIGPDVPLAGRRAARVPGDVVRTAPRRG